MNTREHETVKMRGSADVSYLGRTVDAMIWEFMEQEEIPGLTPGHRPGALYSESRRLRPFRPKAKETGLC